MPSTNPNSSPHRRVTNPGFRAADARPVCEFRAFAQSVRDGSEHGGGLPAFVQREVLGYLDCGILANGCARVKCRECHHEMLVGFSCRGRGLCPSCTTRRMHDTAAHLVGRVIPYVPMRQWVVPFAPRVRWHLAGSRRARPGSRGRR